MRNVKLILLGMLLAVAYVQAGGAASVVAQKSKTKGYRYSFETNDKFMNQCVQGANERICLCVLDKIRHQYSETDYWRYENDLRKNVKHPDYIAYVSNAVEECDAEYAKENSRKFGKSFGGGGGGLSRRPK